MTLGEAANKAARGAALVGGALTVLGFAVEGRPIKDKTKPAKVKFLHLPWFERLENGKQYVLWFRIRDVRRE